MTLTTICLIFGACLIGPAIVFAVLGAIIGDAETAAEGFAIGLGIGFYAIILVTCAAIAAHLFGAL